MIVHSIKCGHNGCGVFFNVTNIQFEDMNCGMMGFIKCPGCQRLLLPQDSNLVNPKPIITQQEVEGEDKGWA